MPPNTLNESCGTLHINNKGRPAATSSSANPAICKRPSYEFRASGPVGTRIASLQVTETEEPVGVEKSKRSSSEAGLSLPTQAKRSKLIGSQNWISYHLQAEWKAYAYSYLGYLPLPAERKAVVSSDMNGARASGFSSDEGTSDGDWLLGMDQATHPDDVAAVKAAQSRRHTTDKPPFVVPQSVTSQDVEMEEEMEEVLEQSPDKKLEKPSVDTLPLILLGISVNSRTQKETNYVKNALMEIILNPSKYGLPENASVVPVLLTRLSQHNYNAAGRSAKRYRREMNKMANFFVGQLTEALKNIPIKEHSRIHRILDFLIELSEEVEALHEKIRTNETFKKVAAANTPNWIDEDHEEASLYFSKEMAYFIHLSQQVPELILVYSSSEDIFHRLSNGDFGNFENMNLRLVAIEPTEDLPAKQPKGKAAARLATKRNLANKARWFPYDHTYGDQELEEKNQKQDGRDGLKEYMTSSES